MHYMLAVRELLRRSFYLLTDTKAAEYFDEQVIAAELAGDFAQGELRAAQILGE